MQRWMDSKAGQTFLNYAYSWGASIVILGTLFKLTHIEGANLMLFIGMGTEVIVFFLSAFDRPFDDKEAPAGQQVVGGGQIIGGTGVAGTSEPGSVAEGATTAGSSAPAQGGIVGGGVIGGGIIGGGIIGGGIAGSAGEGGSVSGEPVTVVGGGNVIGGGIVIGGASGAPATGNVITGGASDASTGTEFVSTLKPEGFGEQGITGQSLLEVIRLANEEMLQRAQASLTPEMEEASREYVEKLQILTETLDRVEKQSARLTTDSEEMTNLNRTLTGINTVYELQLKSISQQIGTIDSINEQTRRMAAQIEELNAVYERMIKALTVNMNGAAGLAQ